jgi:hypothetical protein
VGFLDTILGRSKPAQPNLDELFSLPTAAITLEAGMNLKPTGTGSVCFRAVEGKAFGDIEKDVRELLSMGADSAAIKVSTDSYGFTWLTCEHTPDDFEALVTDLHAVNSSLQTGGFGPQLLCTLVTFTSDTVRRLGIVYLYKQGTFYPFVPKSGQQRDNAVELQVRGTVGADLKIEPDLSRWFAVWGAPGL